MSPELLPSTWETDLKVLTAAVAAIDERGPATDQEIAELAWVELANVQQSLIRLGSTYLVVQVTRDWSGGVMLAVASDVTDLGRRASGQWPSEERILSELQAELERVAQQRGGSAGKAVSDFVRSVGSEALAGVFVTYARHQGLIP